MEPPPSRSRLRPPHASLSSWPHAPSPLDRCADIGRYWWACWGWWRACDWWAWWGWWRVRG
eukprot:scaffold43571_cov47-Phaeocystis_antarctica.AAC.1